MPIPTPALSPRSHPEIWGGTLLKDIVNHNGNESSLSPTSRQYALWARTDFAWWERLESTAMPSWNWDLPIAAALLWLDPDHNNGIGNIPLRITSWWSVWLGLQVGDPAYIPWEQTNPLTRHFDGTETLSSVYAAMRYGAVAAVRLWALRERKRAQDEIQAKTPNPHPEHPAAGELLRLSSRYLEILATLLALSSRPWTDPGYRARNGQWWYHGPTVAPVGERSEASGLQTDQGPILEILRGQVPTSKRAGWAVSFFNQLKEQYQSSMPSMTFAGTPSNDKGSGSGSASIINALSSIRLWSEQHWTRFNTGLLVWKPHRLNPNTPAIFWAWLDDAKQSMTIGYPYPADRHRGKGATGAQGNCKLTRGSNNQWVVSADGIDGGVSIVVALPVNGDPIWSIIGDRTGFREESL